MNSLVSIIIPCYNRAKIILDTLNSIKDQTYQYFECIIVDDGSTDSTISVVEKFLETDNRFSVSKRTDSNKKGANSCRNIGLSKAKGEYIIFFDSDDIMASNCLENRLNHFKMNPNYDMLIFAMGVFDKLPNFEIYPKRNVVNYDNEKTIENFIFSKLLPWNVCRPIFKSSLIKNNIQFNEEIHNFQDEEFNIRLLTHLKPKYLSIDETDCYYRFDELSVNKYKNHKGYQDIIDALPIYFTTVFNALEKDKIAVKRKDLIKNLSKRLKGYVIPKLNLKNAYKTIKIFDSKLKLNLKEKVILYSILYLKKYYNNKKGHFFIIKHLNKSL